MRPVQKILPDHSRPAPIERGLPRAGEQALREVVVIDDDADHLAMLAAALESAGWRVRAFRDPDLALASIADRAPDVLLTDLAMSPIDGVDLAQAIRLVPRLARVPIVALTGVVDPEVRVVRWFDAYLRKPIDLDPLDHLLRTLAERDAPARGSA